jgi:hypothetical protein
MLQYQRHWERNAMEIALMEGLGWYVSRPGKEDQTEYLHVDGQWRASTVTKSGDTEKYTGYFPNQVAAEQAATRFGNCGRTIKDPGASNAMALAFTRMRSGE